MTSSSAAHPVTVIAHYRVRAGHEDEVRDLLARHSVASEAEPGCRQFLAHQSDDDPTRFALYEVYDDPAAFEAHRQTGHFRTNIEQTLVPLLEERGFALYGAPLR